ncbi:glycoside hydrolase family 15 protein [Candidatus Peregrinibacteria bacterium]|nr:glycoside hydrolase family 15 protein [Candidatus Peregrinibacteria bacterium]
MPRAAVSGNGNLLACLNRQNLLEDLYFPYVGMEDHIDFQHWHRVGVYINGRFSWLTDRSWEHETNYLPETLVTNSRSKNVELGLSLEFNDFVYPSENVFVRKITIHNEVDYDRELKIYFNQDFHLYGDKQQDTAFYDPEYKAMIHYRKRRYFWICGMQNGKAGIDSFTTGKSEYRGLEGTWKDAEDGNLHEHPIEQGSVDSTVQFNVSLKARSKQILYVWICAGKDLDETEDMHEFILHENPEKLLKNTVNYWLSWVNKEADKGLQINPHWLKLYKQSLLIIRTQIDNRGAIIAANDSDIMKFNKDTYTYMWPRDGAWVSIALDHAGYGEITKRFFQFCAETMTEEGYLLHKYNPDKSVGSSWHPWYKDGEMQMPIQEDETAIVTYALLQHWKHYKDIEFVQEMYESLIRAAGSFMAHFIDEKTGLPLPTYDLWERERGIFLYTAACVYAGLDAAGKLSSIIGHFNHAERYKEAAVKMRAAIVEHLYDKEEKRFLKRVELNPKTREIKKDYGLDASMHALWMMGVLPPDDERVIRTNKIMQEKLAVHTHIGGMARSENDDYQRVSGDYGAIPGNPWIITTLWHAQWLLTLAKTPADLEEIKGYIDWATKQANPAGILPEQVSPFNGEPLSVAPLTWSHATYVDTILKFDKKAKELNKKS